MNKGGVIAGAVMLAVLAGAVGYARIFDTAPVEGDRGPTSDGGVRDELLATEAAPAIPEAYREEQAVNVYSDELASVVRGVGLPMIEGKNDDMSCSAWPIENKLVHSAEICSEQTMSPCAFSNDQTCEVSSIFVNGWIGEIGYKYDSSQFSPPAVKSALDAKFGRSRWKTIPTLTFPDGSWISGQTAEWRTGNIRIFLQLNGGRNFEGEDYLKAALSVADLNVPDPAGKR